MSIRPDWMLTIGEQRPLSPLEALAAQHRKTLLSVAEEATKIHKKHFDLWCSITGLHSDKAIADAFEDFAAQLRAKAEKDG